MGKTSAKVKDRYNKKVYDDVRLRVKAGRKEIIEAYAKSKGLSLNGYINKLIDDDMASGDV